MSDFNGRQYTKLRGINLQESNGILRFETPLVAPTTTSGERLLYVNSSNELIYNSGTSATVLGAAGAGGGSASSWDAIYAGDKVMAISGTTLTFDLTHASNNGLTLTATGAGTGHLLQITNVGTGNDINGTSNTWYVSKAGDAVFNTISLSGDADSSSFAMTVGDFAMSDGKMAITNQDNENTFVVTNNGNTSASQVAFAGSGVFTGSTTTSFFTITPSGLTTGTAVYLPVAALTTGKALHVVANALTDGLLVNVTSSATAISATGRMVCVDHSGATTTSGVIAEFKTAAGDETVLMQLTASGALALGTLLKLSGSSVTTGNGMTIADLDSLTDGYGVHVASAATAITSTGHLLFVNHSGATTTSGVLSEFKTAATDETVVVKVTTAAMINGVGLSIVGTTGMTSGSLLRVASSTAAAVITNGIVSFTCTGNFTSNAVNDGGFVEVKADSTTAGTIFNLTGEALTTGVGMVLSNATSAMTTGSLLRVNASGTGAIATNGIVSFTHAGVFTSTSAVDGGFVEVKANATTAGTIVNVVGSALTGGIGLQLSNGTSAMTTGSLLRVTASGTGIIATNGIVSITHAGIFTSTSNAGVFDVRASALVGTGTVANFMSTAADQLTSTVMNIENSGFTTGYTGTMVRIKSPTTTGACKVVGIIADGMTTAGVGLHISAAALSTGGMGISVDVTAATAGNLLNLITTGAYTGTGMALITAGAMTTGILLSLVSTTGLTSGSLIRATSSTAGAIATNGAISFSATGAFTSTDRIGFLNVAANTTTGGTIAHISGTSVTDGTVLSLEATEATLTTGLYLQCYDGAANDFSVGRYGATVIAGSASGTASLTQTAGDHVLVAGNLTLTNGYIKGTPQAIVNANTAIDVTHLVTTIANNGASTHTLADGVVGQLKTIVCTVYAADAVITPTNFVGTTITLNAAGDAWTGIFVGTEWVTLALGGTAAVA